MTRNFKIKNNEGVITLDVRCFSNSKKQPLFIFCHGFKGFKDWGCFPYILEQITQNEITTVSFNFSFNGLDNTKSNPTEFTRLDLFARNTISRELNDLLKVLDFLESEKENFNYDFENLTLAGHSRGGGIAIIKANEDKRIKKLITLASVSDFNRYTKERKSEWKSTGYLEVLNARTKQLMRINYSYIEDLDKNKHRLDIKNALKNLKIPVLIIHGKEDLAVDYSEAEELYYSSNKNLTQIILLNNTGHTFGSVHPFKGTNPIIEKVIKEIIKFITGK